MHQIKHEATYNLSNWCWNRCSQPCAEWW